MNRPEPEDFGLTSAEYERVRGKMGPLDRPLTFYVIPALSVVVGIAAAILLHDGTVLMVVVNFFIWMTCGLLGAMILTVLLDALVGHFQPAFRKKKLYEKAVQAYRFTLVQFWQQMTGKQFELSLAMVYSEMGYHVQHTGHSGDKGIDLILKKGDRTLVVQCKAHKTAVGPAVVRELYGAMSDYGADGAVLASTSGFTSGVRAFVVGKPIELLQASDVARMMDTTGIPPG